MPTSAAEARTEARAQVNGGVRTSFFMIVVDWLPYLSSINHDHEKCLIMPPH
jgi:hypothetical protein